MFEHFDKKYLKDVGLKLIAALGVVAFGVYLAYQAWHYFAVNVTCISAMAFTVSEKSSGDGCIFRSEVPLSSAGGGSLVASVDSGTRVGIGDEVSRIFTASSIDIEKRLSEIEDQISLLSSSVYSQSITNRDVTKLDGEVYDTVTAMSRNIASGNFADALANRSSFISTVNRRSVASGATVDFAAQVAQLQQEKSELTGRLGALKSTVYAPVAGWYYPECDGYENVFTVDKLANLTYDGFRELAKTHPTSPAGAGKIVTNCNWYFVCEINRQSVREKEIGKYYTLYFPYNRNEKILMKLEKVCEGEDGFAAAVFTTDKMPSGFDFLRMQSYELLEREYTGFKVPRSAVRIINGQMGVFVLSGEVVHFRKIEVMTEYENYYIVKMDHTEEDEQASETPETSEDKPSDDTNQESGGFDPRECPWLMANENIIVKGKGMREGRIITNMN